jgi:hypothetical protein
MIEIMLLLLLGNADALVDLQLDVDAQTELVADLELKFEALKVEKTAKEITMNKLFNEFKQYEKEELWDNSQTRQEFVEFKARELKTEWRIDYFELGDMKKESVIVKDELAIATALLESMEKDLENLAKANSKTDRYGNVSISLSKNCKTLIEYNMYTNCPTYRELFEMFDTTDPMVSGVMVDYGYDVQRESIMNKHWNFYDTYNNFNIVMVDPDSIFQDRSVNIEIQVRDFTTLSKQKTKDGLYTTWQNFKITNDCKRILVAPDMVLITEAIEFAKNNCSGEVEHFKEIVIKQKTTPHDYKKWHDSPALVYQNWLKDAITNNKELRIGLD